MLTALFEVLFGDRVMYLTRRQLEAWINANARRAGSVGR